MTILESDYFHNRDHFGQRRGYDERKLYPLHKYDMGHPVQYHIRDDVGRYRHKETLYSDFDEQLDGHYGEHLAFRKFV